MKNFFLYLNKLIVPSLFLIAGFALLITMFSPGKPQTTWFMLGGGFLILFSIIWILLQLNIVSGKYASIMAIVLVAPIIFLAFRNYKSIQDELKFIELVDQRFDAVINHLVKIREAEIAYKETYGIYSNDFDSLIYFINNGEVPILKQIGNMDDTIAVANGEAYIDTNWVPVVGNSYVITFPVDSLRYVPYGKDNMEFMLDAGDLYINDDNTVPVFEASANWKDFLGDLWDDYGRMPKDSLIRVGSMDEPTTNGSWGN